jgi:hypothetical protein
LSLLETIDSSPLKDDSPRLEERAARPSAGSVEHCPIAACKM